MLASLAWVALVALVAFTALVARVALVAFVAVPAVLARSAFAAVGTFPSLSRLTCLPVIVWCRRRLPDNEFFAISLSPLTSFHAAIAVPDTAMNSASVATTMDADGLRQNTLFMGTPMGFRTPHTSSCELSL